MGKRNSRKNNAKKIEIERFEPSKILDRELKTIHENISKIEHQKCLIESRSQIKNYISNIYNEFSKEIDKRRAERINCKASFDEKSLPKLTITHDFTKRIHDLLAKINDDESVDEIKDCVYKNASGFVEQLKQTLNDIASKGKKLQILLMHDSYTFLKNLSNEIRRILSSVFQNDEKGISNYHKKLFYKHVMKSQPDLINYIINDKWQSYSETQILKVFRKFEELEKFATKEKIQDSGFFLYENLENEIFEKSSYRLSTASSLSVEKDSFEFINFSSVDQVVNYIEGKTGKSKKKKKTKKANAQTEDLFAEIDREVGEFEQKLRVLPPLVKKKVMFSEEFLQLLREKIQEMKSIPKIT